MSTQIKELLLNNEVIHPVTTSDAVIFEDNENLTSKINNKQSALVSGENIKTVRGQSLLGSGDIPVLDGANVLFYTGLFFNNGGQTVYDPSASKYQLLADSQYYGGISTKKDDIILIFVDSVLVVTKNDGTGNTNYVSVDKLTTVDLKGQIGDIGPAGVTSASVYIDNTSGTPAAQISVNNQVLTLVLSGLKGLQGNSGYSGAANELEVVNNLTDGGTTSALSAEMGKELNESIPHIVTISEEAYDLLVLNNTVDENIYYFIYE